MKISVIALVGVMVFVSQMAFAEPKKIEKISYVYVLDDGQSFDFSAGAHHECGTNIYRTRAADAGILNRKFSLVLTAYTARKRLTINTSGCDGNRLLFNWVRLHD